MSEAVTSLAPSTRFYGMGIVAIAAVNLALGAFDPTQPVPDGFPGRTALAYATSLFLLLAGVATVWRRTAPWSAAALAAYYAIIVALLMNVPAILVHPTEYGAYFGFFEGFALAAAGFIIFAASGTSDRVIARRLTRAAQIAFGLCALFFGGAHFVYPSLTIPLVPNWLLPSQSFWAYATGLFHIAAGLALLTGIRSRLAAILLTIMYAAFTPLVHLPLLLGSPSNHFFWTENVLNLALVGVAWVVADSLRSPG